jgi:hypothetical protein
MYYLNDICGYFQHLVIGNSQNVCSPLNMTFLPKHLKQAGYATHAIGKYVIFKNFLSYLFIYSLLHFTNEEEIIIPLG